MGEIYIYIYIYKYLLTDFVLHPGFIYNYADGFFVMPGSYIYADWFYVVPESYVYIL